MYLQAPANQEELNRNLIYILNEINLTRTGRILNFLCYAIIWVVINDCSLNRSSQENVYQVIRTISYPCSVHKEMMLIKFDLYIQHGDQVLSEVKKLAHDVKIS